MSNRRRQDGQPTADELKLRAERCPGFLASDGDALICVRCQAHQELHPKPEADDDVEDLAQTLPPSDQGDGDSHVADAPPSAEAVAERQADAAADSAPAVGSAGDEPPPNSKSRYEIIQEKFSRLAAIKLEQKVLRDEASEIVDDLEKQQGVNRGGLAEVRKLFGLDAATIKQREESRQELFNLLIAPKLKEAEAGQADE